MTEPIQLTYDTLAGTHRVTFQPFDGDDAEHTETDAIRVVEQYRANCDEWHETGREPVENLSIEGGEVLVA